MKGNGLRRAAAAALAAPLAACAAGPAAPVTGEDAVVTYQPEYPQYGSVTELYDRATLVVEGRVSGHAEQLQLDVADSKAGDTAGLVYTVRTIEVAAVIKGDVETGEQVPVKQLGGVVDGRSYREAEGADLLANVDYLLFLETYTDSPASLLNPIQGQYVVNSVGGLTSAPDNPITIDRRDLHALEFTHQREDASQ